MTKAKAMYAAKAGVRWRINKLWMAERLANGECCVQSSSSGVGADFSTVSKHLSVLRQAGIIGDDKRGQQVYYRLRVPCVLKFMDCVSAVLHSRAERRAQGAFRGRGLTLYIHINNQAKELWRDGLEKRGQGARPHAGRFSGVFYLPVGSAFLK